MAILYGEQEFLGFGIKDVQVQGKSYPPFFVIHIHWCVCMYIVSHHHILAEVEKKIFIYSFTQSQIHSLMQYLYFYMLSGGALEHSLHDYHYTSIIFTIILNFSS